MKSIIKFLSIAIFLSVTLMACEKENITPIQTYFQEEVSFRSTTDYAGVWKIQMPFARYFDVDASGNYIEVRKVGSNYIPKSGGLTGTFTEVAPGQVHITGIYDSADWTLIETVPYWTLETNLPQYKIFVRVSL